MPRLWSAQHPHRVGGKQREGTAHGDRPSSGRIADRRYDVGIDGERTFHDDKATMVNGTTRWRLVSDSDVCLPGSCLVVRDGEGMSRDQGLSRLSAGSVGSDLVVAASGV